MSELQGNAAIQMYLHSWRGYSAYEIAVQNGFEGTEEAWLESLKGEKGDPAQEVTVNNKAPVDGNITIRATDVYMQPDRAPDTVADALDKRVRYADVVNALDSEETDKPLSAAAGKCLERKMPVISTCCVALPAADWEQDGEIYGQSAVVSGVTQDADKTVVFASPPAERALEEAYVNAEIRASAQGDGVVVFTCTQPPLEDVEANVMVVVLGVSE